MGTINPTILNGCDWLNGQGRNVTSQFGEDGLIRAAFERIGITNKWCFEVGAADGIGLSNTKQWRDEGWNAVLIEADAKKFAQLEQHKTDREHVIHEKIGSDSLDQLLGALAVPTDMDLGVIDIDGQDYWVWDGMKKYTPRVMLVEFSPYGTGAADRLCERDGPGQTGLNPILALGESKGYMAVVKTFCNVLFVRKELLG
jgi:hypothetical protein